jgi:hypothetical protein
MKKLLFLGFILLSLTACSGQIDISQETSLNVLVYKSPT